MSSPLMVPRLRILALLLVWLIGGPVMAQMPGVTARFFTKRAVVWQDATQVIPINLAAPAEADETFTASADDSTLLEVLRVPTVLAGETIGYLRVRGLKAGRTQIHLHPGEAINVEVKPDPAAGALSDVDPDRSRVRIVTPMENAVVFGQFGVGVEVFDSPIASQPQDMFHAWTPPAPPKTSIRVQLRLPDGRLLDPVAQTEAESSPQREYTFSVSASDMAPGPFQLVALATPAEVSVLDARSGSTAVQQSLPLKLVAMPAPKIGTTLAGECEAVLADTKEALAPLRPSQFGTKQPETIPDSAASGARTLGMTSGNSAWCMPVVIKQAGDYEMFIEARGQTAFGIYPTVALYVNNAERPAGLVRLAGPRYHRLPVGGRIALEAGPQVLTVSYRNDFNVAKEDRNLFLDRYELVRVGDSPPPVKKPEKGAVPPAALASLPSNLLPPPVVAPAGSVHLSLLYPANGANVFGADAAVARFSSSAPLAWIDLVLDGQPQGTRIGNPHAGEAILLPMLLRGVTPGQHRVAIRGGMTGAPDVDSPAQLINVLPQAPAVAGPYDRAVRLLDRLAFGAEPAELAAVLTLGESAWLNNRLAGSFDSPAEQTAFRAACAQFPNGDDSRQTAARALQQWLASDNPVRTRFTAWAENHFTTWINKTKAAPKWNEHYDFSRLGIAPFADLLDASAHSPAMIAYLDQEKSYASKLNENYAREIMELHTLGVHGGYKQTDVTALASVLNGWTLASEASLPEHSTQELTFHENGGEAGLAQDFIFAPPLNDGKPRRVFGMQFPQAGPTARYDRVRLAIEMLASHPNTAEHVCRKLAEHYVAVPAPDRLVAAMAQTFLENGGDMRAVLRTMAARPEFWQADYKLATPLDFGVRLGRLCRAAAISDGADPNQAARADAVEDFLKRSGMGLFDHVSPDGYPENSASYADSNAMLQRWRYTQAIVEPLNRLTPVAWRKPPETPASIDQRQRFIDLAALRLTGRLLSPDSNAAALDVMGDPTPDHMRQTMVFVSLLPEVNLR